MIVRKHVLLATAVLLAFLISPLTLAEPTYQQAQEAYDVADYGAAEAIWLQLAATGDEEAMFALGALLLEGPGEITIDYTLSTAWFMKSARLGHPEAQYNLGNAYQKGLGVEQSDQQAVYWWKRAAAQGMPNAAYNLGVQYMYGRGVPQDYQQALKLFQFAAARNHLAARKLLISWNFEIPELAGADEKDAAELGKLLGVDPADPLPPEATGPATGSMPAVSAESMATSGSASAGQAKDTMPVAEFTGEPESAPTRDTEQATLTDAKSAVVAGTSVATVPDTPPTSTPEQRGGQIPGAANTEEPATSPAATREPVVADVSGEATVKLAGSTAATQSAADAVAAAATGRAVAKPVTPEPGISVAPAEDVTAPAPHPLGKPDVLAVPDGRFTLQLAVMSTPAGVDRFIRMYQLEGDLYRFSYSRGSKMLHGLSIGNFSSREAAGDFQVELSERMQHKPGWKKPWLRPFADIRRLVEAAQSTDR